MRDPPGEGRDLASSIGLCKRRNLRDGPCGGGMAIGRGFFVTGRPGML
jgi:hypothetical protein